MNKYLNIYLCVTGQKYGILEIKIVLANLMRQFQFTVADASQPMLIPSSEVVLKPKHGVPLIVSKRATLMTWITTNSTSILSSFASLKFPVISKKKTLKQNQFVRRIRLEYFDILSRYTMNSSKSIFTRSLIINPQNLKSAFCFYLPMMLKYIFF